MTPVRILLILTLTSACVFGCIAPVKHEFSTDFPAWVLSAVGTPPVSDGRVRFREIFCQLLTEEPEYLEPSGSCGNFLLRLNDEPLPDGTPDPVPTPAPDARYRVLVVPGLLNECFAGIALPFEDAINNLDGNGFKIEALVVSGRSSSESNALFIAETIENLNLEADEKVLLVGHSKGAVDILHFLVQYPQASSRIAGVISVAGAINGSPLAVKFEDIYTRLAPYILSNRCDIGDEGAINSLQPALRMSWLAANPLPASVRYFSVAAMTSRKNINLLLKPGYDLLWTYGPRNDGLLHIADQIIPGGTLLGYANADHWSVVLPLEDKQSYIASTVQASAKYPRNVLLRAILLYVIEALAKEQVQD